MRTNEPAWDTKPSNPIGEKVMKPTPSKPEWMPRPGSPGVEQNAKGELRTNIPDNEVTR